MTEASVVTTKLGAPGFISTLARFAGRVPQTARRQWHGHADAVRALAGNPQAGLRQLSSTDMEALTRRPPFGRHLLESIDHALPGAMQGATSAISLRQVPQLARRHQRLMQTRVGDVSVHQALQARDMATAVPFLGRMVDDIGRSRTGRLQISDMPGLLALSLRALRDGAAASGRHPVSAAGAVVRQVVRGPGRLAPEQLTALPRAQRRIRERSLQRLTPALGGGFLAGTAAYAGLGREDTP